MTPHDFLTVCLIIGLSVMLIGLGLIVYRLIKGPNLVDRIVALDIATTLGLGFIAIYAIRSGIKNYLDIGIALTLLAFLSTVAFAQYVQRRGVRTDAIQPPLPTDKEPS